MINKFGSNSFKAHHKQKIIKIVNIVFLVVISLTSFYLISPLEFTKWHPLLLGVEKSIFGFLILIILFSILIFKKLISNFAIQLTAIDLLLSAYIASLFLHATFINPTPKGWDSIFLIENFLLGILYICYRNIRTKFIVVIWTCFILGNLFQIYYGFSMQTHWFSPGYGFADIRGNFVNQGPFACALVCNLILCVGLVKKYQKRISYQKLFLKSIIIVIILILFGLMATLLFYIESRASWLACIVGVFYCFTQTNTRKIRFNFFSSKWKKLVSIVILLFLIIGLGKTLYLHKKDSADGRILIWKVGFEMIDDRPFIGHGIDSFRSRYMVYQANYLQSRPEDSLRNLAGDNRYAFNEFLRICVEQGILGLITVFLLIYILIRYIRAASPPPKNNFLTYAVAGLLSILVFGLFSYPLEIMAIKIMAVSFLAILSGSSKTIFKETNKGRSAVKKFKTGIVMIPVLFALAICGHSIIEIYKTRKNWSFALFELGNGNSAKYILFSEKNYELLKFNGDFLALYGKSLLQAKYHEDAIKILNEAKRLIPSTVLLMDLGKAYERSGLDNKALYNWQTASRMVPAQFYPQYLIIQMYLKRGQKEKAKKMAKDLLNSKKIKIHSPEVYYILEDLKKISQGRGSINSINDKISTE